MSIWLNEEQYEEWRTSEGGEDTVKDFVVEEHGRWSRPAPRREEVVVQRVVGWW